MPDNIRGFPKRYGLTIRQCAGAYPDLDAVASAAKRLDRAPYITDASGYDCDILAASIHPEDERFTYIEQRAKPGRHGVDVAIKIHYVDPEGCSRSEDIRSYNPFFGCNVRFLNWYGDLAILVYREKHRTYAVRFGSVWPPDFREIADRWIIRDRTLAYFKSDGYVSRMSIPEFEELGRLTEAEARSLNLYPQELHGFLDWPEKST